jgi:hypothetical protein
VQRIIIGERKENVARAGCINKPSGKKLPASGCVELRSLGILSGLKSYYLVILHRLGLVLGLPRVQCQAQVPCRGGVESIYFNMITNFSIIISYLARGPAHSTSEYSGLFSSDINRGSSSTLAKL